MAGTERVAVGTVSLGCGLIGYNKVEILRRRRVQRVHIGCVGRRLSVLAQDKVEDGYCSLSGGQMDVKRQGSLVQQMLTFVPAVCVAWGYCAVLPSFAWSMKKTSFQESVPKTSVGLMVGNGYSREMSQTDMDALMNYYLDPPSHSHRNGGKSTHIKAPSSSKKMKKKTDEVVNKNETTKMKADTTTATQKKVSGSSESKKQHQLTDNDNQVARVEFRAALAVAAVCAVAVLFWRWKYMMDDESSYGIESEIRNLDLTPIRDVDTGESQEEKEQVRLEAMKRIERAKRAEETYMKLQAAGEEKEDKEENIDVPSTVFRSVQEPPAPLVVPSESAEERALMAQSTSDSNTRDVHPGLLAFALMSVIVDDISKEIKNQPKTVRPESRVLSCSSNRKHAGRSMSVSSPRVKITKKNTSVGHGPKHQHVDLLLAPIAPLVKSVSGKPKLSLLGDKYNPVHEFHEFVSKLDTKTSAVTSDRDPFHALVDAIKAFDGFKTPESIEKFDPISNLDKLQERNTTDQDVDPVISFIRAAATFDGLRASEFISKYDPLQGMEKITPEYGSSEYNMFQGLLRTNPTGSKDYSIIQALLKASPDASHYDVWKAVVNVSPPETGEKNELLSAADSFIEYLRKPIGIDFSKYDFIHNFLGRVGPSPKDE